MTNLTHGSIIPLIGGMTLGMERAFGKPPEYFATWPDFEFNERSARKHYSSATWLVEADSLPFVNVTHAVPPCAGLCRLSMANTYSSVIDNESNKWLLISAELAFKSRPNVHIAENAPALATELGRPIREKLIQLADNYNYKLSFYSTIAAKHGLPQNRKRCFLFAWDQEVFNGIPVAPWFDIEPKNLTQLVLDSHSPSAYCPPRKPSEWALWQYVRIRTGLTAMELYNRYSPIPCVGFIMREFAAEGGINRALKDISDPGFWSNFGFSADECENFSDPNKHSIKLLRKAIYKLSIGKGFMDTSPVFGGRGCMRALVGNKLGNIVHPLEDRFLSQTELYGLMGMPIDYPWENGSKLNVIAQNVPTTTAQSMGEIAIKAINGELPLVNGHYVFQNNLSKVPKIRVIG